MFDGAFKPVLIKSIMLFILAGLFEIGGGYLVWQWWRNGARFVIGALGGLILFLYGIVPTYQPENFGRVYVAYGGWFVILSIVWGWGVDHVDSGFAHSLQNASASFSQFSLGQRARYWKIHEPSVPCRSKKFNLTPLPHAEFKSPLES